ncbi:transpeptidase family protein [Pseudoflavitalea sp. X16]|uniref:penicillin-binding protein n=1 Tax=Paraflavitalea devenefica TaxID=2716334 RepID=UPI00141E941D|nr:penicillin-binding protein [Paraflavitalea devenefica]NII23500.1 transpeptidase family protein [Paraflavitalea devenefica]
MEVKRDILWRVYLCFIGIVIFSVVILMRAVYIQQVQGTYWINQAKDQQQRFVEIDAERGTIYSEDGSMLSTSLPYFNIYIDFMAEGLREKNGKRFKDHVDSLSGCLANYFKDRSSTEYKQLLTQGYRKKDRFFLFKKNLSFQQYKELRTMPLIRQGRDKSGFIPEVKDKRLNPFGLLANRTIGLSREYIDSDGKIKNTNVGIEKTYDTVLKGQSGKRLMRKIAAGVFVPVDGSEIEPQNGKDIITTLDVNMQDIAENALLKVLTQYECEYGTCLVMEVKTGKIKAIANLGRRSDGSYWEDMNYAIRASEPGSTFKLATMLSLLEDKYTSLNHRVNLEGGVWTVNGRTVYDSENHGYDVSVKEAFEMSSNVGMAKLVTAYYSKKPLQFVEHLKRMRFDQYSGIDLLGETTPIVKTPKSRTWSATSLPWMSFGYEVLVSPLQTLMLYNAIANDGKMMKPYLVNAVKENGLVVKENKPEVLEEAVCNEQTLKLLQELLKGVCSDPHGTGTTLFKGAPYKVAGKTGTSLMANGNRGYADQIYQSSFAGYFPADNPQYSCIVVVKNKPRAAVYYGAKIAGPVFKELADKLYALNADKDKKNQPVIPVKKDSSYYLYAGAAEDMQQVMKTLQWKYRDSAGAHEWTRLYAANYEPVMDGQPVSKKNMPDVRGMGLKDALYLLENMQAKVIVRGRGKVKAQSVEPGTAFVKNQSVTIELN